MARSLTQIYDAIITEKQSLSSLDDLQPSIESSQLLLTELTTTSNVGNWRVFLWLIAFAIWCHEVLWDVQSAEVVERAEEIIPGTLRWYVNQALAFQYGYELEWDGDKYVYADTTSQDAIDSRIITQAAAIESNGEVIIKIAAGEIGALAPLATVQSTAFSAYMDDVGFAGIPIDIINEAADDLKLALTIYYDPLLIELDSSTPVRGMLITDNSIYPVEDAITDFIQAIPFNSVFRLIDLVDAIQAATGVINVIVNNADARYGAIAYTDIVSETNQSYTARAGYLAMATGYELDDYFADAYDAGTTYAESDYCVSSLILYRSLADANTANTPASSPTWWEVVRTVTVADLPTLTYTAG